MQTRKNLQSPLTHFLQFLRALVRAIPSRPTSPALILFLTAHALTAADIHVAPDGDDNAAGTETRPVRSLVRARELARSNDGPTRVVLHPGTWRVGEPLMFGPADGGVTWRAAEADTAVISGGLAITEWAVDDNGDWSAPVPSKLKGVVRELFVNGERRTRARTPDEGYFRIEQAAEDKRSGFRFRAGDVADVPDLAQVELVFLHDWSISRVGVRSVDEASSELVTRDPIGANARHYAIDWFEPNPRYFLENSRAYLDQPGEWFHDLDAGRLIYRPLPGETPAETVVVAPLATRLVEVRGEPSRPVRDLHFEGIGFEHCNWQIPEKGYAEGQANYHESRTGESGILREIIPAAIHFELAEDCSLRNLRVRQVGGGGVWFGSRTKRCVLVDSVVEDVSGNGVLIGEDSGRSIDGDTWWRVAPEQAATGNRVENCVIRRCGRQFFGAVGVWVGFTQGTAIVRNEIYDLTYTGVSLGWMWNPTPTPNGNNLVAANHIHHVMQVHSDGGGIYTLGRQPGTVLRDNLIHDVPVNLGRAESNGMFLDEGTAEIVVENNAIYGIDKSPLRFHKAEQNIVRNNLLVVKEGVPHIRYNNTPEENIEQLGNTIAREEARQP